jgi:type IV secretory pathway VirB4 component
MNFIEIHEVDLKTLSLKELEELIKQLSHKQVVYQEHNAPEIIKEHNQKRLTEVMREYRKYQ